MDKSKIILTGISVTLLVALLISFRSCMGFKQEAEDAGDYIASANDTIQYLKDSAIAQKHALSFGANAFADLVDERADLQKALDDANVKIKNLHSIATVISHSTIAPGHDSIIIQHVKIPCDEEFTPVPFSVDSPYYSISGKIGDEYITISRLDFPDTLSMVVFTDRHFFRKNELKISAHHSNKYIRTTGLESFTIREEKKWYQSKWIPLAAGLLGGYMIFK